MKKKVSIILATHSNYLDICNIFLKLFNINWSDCPFQIIISITGENVKIDGYECVYNGMDATLPDCIKNVCLKRKDDYYICLLGDAFIVEKIDTKNTVAILNELIGSKTEYCNLIPKKIKKEKIEFREICKQDIYYHSFVGFFASHEFILNEFTHGSTDLDFEEKYLKIAVETRNNDKFDRHYILNKNIFHIMPGISKGLWNRDVHAHLHKTYSGINLGDRGKLSYAMTIKGKIIKIIQPRLNPRLRFKVKNFLSSYFNMEFTSKF